MSNIYASVIIEHLTCGACGVHFGLDAIYHQKVQNDGSWFYCPNGHHVRYAETELDRERRKTERYQQWLEDERQRVEAERKAHAATKGKLTRTRKRLAGGVCPCCNRTFENLQRHMHTKHPTYAEELVVPPAEPHPSEVVGGTLHERIEAIMADGKQHTAKEIAQTLTANTATVTAYLARMQHKGMATKPSYGVYQVAKA